jgi:hypothetical protein
MKFETIKPLSWGALFDINSSWAFRAKYALAGNANKFSLFQYNLIEMNY